MSANRVRNTVRSAKILIKLDAIWTTQPGAGISQDSIHCFALTKI
jgi:hypothetical protein